MAYVVLVLSVLGLVVLIRSVKIVAQKQVKIIERLGKFHTKADAGLNIIVPFIDAVRASHDLRERITKIEPQPVITRDNVTMEVDAVIYYLIVDPVRATYEVQNLEWGMEQLTLSALRNVVGAMDLDHTLTSRDTINTQLRAALDAATQQWGVKVVRVELKNINPPEEIKVTMEKQMTAERVRRAAVTTAEGEKASAILRAEGLKQSAVVSAEGEKQSAILRAEGEAEARLRLARAEAEALQVTAQALGAQGNPAQYLIAKSYLQSLTAIAGRRRRSCFCRSRRVRRWGRSGACGSCGAMGRRRGRRGQRRGRGAKAGPSRRSALRTPGAVAALASQVAGGTVSVSSPLAAFCATSQNEMSLTHNAPDAAAVPISGARAGANTPRDGSSIQTHRWVSNSNGPA